MGERDRMIGQRLDELGKGLSRSTRIPSIIMTIESKSIQGPLCLESIRKTYIYIYMRISNRASQTN